MIHKFKQRDLNIVVDVNSGAIHVVDDIVYAVLDDYTQLPKDDIISKLENRFDNSNINEALDRKSVV